MRCRKSRRSLVNVDSPVLLTVAAMDAAAEYPLSIYPNSVAIEPFPIHPNSVAKEPCNHVNNQL